MYTHSLPSLFSIPVLVSASISLLGCWDRPKDCEDCPVVIVDRAQACPDWRWIGIVGASPVAPPDRPTPPPPEVPVPVPVDPVPPPVEPLPEHRGEARGEDPASAAEAAGACTLPRRLEALGWSARPLFCPWSDPASPPSACGLAGIPAPLRKYCLYEHEDRGGELTAEPAGPGEHVPGLSAIARDCMVVIPAGERGEPTEFDRKMRPTLETHFYRQVSRPPMPAQFAPTRIRLALLDTAPTNADNPEAGPYNSRHGYSLVNMAKQLLCRPQGCLARVTARLALPWVKYHPTSRLLSERDDLRGGFVGLLGDLAQAIRQEVAAWGPGRERLVLNLSVGFDRDHGDETGGQAVEDALRDAAGHGALVFAAAGNKGWGPTPARGPLLPAGWEGEVPGVFAVGGIRADGRRLPNARFLSEPRLVAFADHAVVQDHRGEPIATLTGTSVGTVVVSAAAAVRWRSVFDTPRDRIVTELYGMGTPLPRDAQFCVAEDCEVRRICADPESSCGAPDPQLAGRVDAVLHETFSDAPELDLGWLPETEPFHGCPPEVPRRILELDQETLHTNRPRPSVDGPCPHWQLPSPQDQVMVGTQPGSNQCLGCTESPSCGAVYIEISPEFRDRKLTHPVLVVGDDSYDLHVLTPWLNTAPWQARVTGVRPESDDEIFFSVVVDGRRSVTSPVWRPQP